MSAGLLLDGSPRGIAVKNADSLYFRVVVVILAKDSPAEYNGSMWELAAPGGAGEQDRNTSYNWIYSDFMMS